MYKLHKPPTSIRGKFNFVFVNFAATAATGIKSQDKAGANLGMHPLP